MTTSLALGQLKCNVPILFSGSQLSSTRTWQCQCVQQDPTWKETKRDQGKDRITSHPRCRAPDTSSVPAKGPHSTPKGSVSTEMIPRDALRTVSQCFTMFHTLPVRNQNETCGLNCKMLLNDKMFLLTKSRNTVGWMTKCFWTRAKRRWLNCWISRTRLTSVGLASERIVHWLHCHVSGWALHMEMTVGVSWCGIGSESQVSNLNLPVTDLKDG